MTIFSVVFLLLFLCVYLYILYIFGLWFPRGFRIVLYIYMISLVSQMLKNFPAIQKTQLWSLSQEDPLEKWMVTYRQVKLNCWSLKFQCISNILHLYSYHNRWLWYHICMWMISYLYFVFALPVSFPIHIFCLFLVMAFSFLLREVPLRFVLNLV